MTRKGPSEQYSTKTQPTAQFPLFISGGSSANSARKKSPLAKR